MWIYEQASWPEFCWEFEKIAVVLADLRHRQGRLMGRLESLGFDLRQETTLAALTSEVIMSSAIEGELLSTEEVRSSIAKRLGIEIGGYLLPNRQVEGIVDIMLDATQHYQTPLTKERLFAWHAALFPAGRSGMHRINVGAWRTLASGPMRVVSGPMGRETVHFEAPKASQLDQEMSTFLAWFEGSEGVDPLLKAGIAHLWFVTIHPFDDGNGRIGRAIADMALARAEQTSDRFYSLSAQIEAERKAYYLQLEMQQRGTTDITVWLEWFLGCFSRALLRAENSLKKVLFKAELWKKVNEKPVNERQRVVINRMLEDHFEGHMNTSKYASMAKCSTDTAIRDIQVLKKRGVFLQNPAKGRSTSYRLVDELGLIV